MKSSPLVKSGNLYLVRHGETEWNLEGRSQGRADSPLTLRGHEQARSAARALRLQLGDSSRLVSSPTGRALATAEVAAEALGLALEQDPLLRECDLGDWTGLTKSDVEARDPGMLAQRELDKWNFRMPGGESYVDLDVRARRWLASLDAGPTIAVTHEMFGRALLGAVLELAPEGVLALQLGHGRVYRIGEDGFEELVDPEEPPASGPLPRPHVEQVAALEASYLESEDPVEQSGFGGGSERWLLEREPILDGIARSGELLDVGCANGHLLDCLCSWGERRGLKLSPYGLDLGARLVESARARLPHGEFWVGDAWEWNPTRRFENVYLLYDCVPREYLEPQVRRLLERALRPGGRLILGAYGSASRRLVPFDVGRFLAARGFEVLGSTRVGRARFAWIEASRA